MQFSLRNLLAAATFFTLACWYVTTFSPEDTAWSWWISCSTPILFAVLLVTMAYEGIERMWTAVVFGVITAQSLVFVFAVEPVERPTALVGYLALTLHVATFCGGVQLISVGRTYTGFALVGLVLLSTTILINPSAVFH